MTAGQAALRQPLATLADQMRNTLVEASLATTAVLLWSVVLPLEVTGRLL